MRRHRPKIIAQARFEQHAGELLPLPLEARFQYIYQHNLWGNEESRSGNGSTIEETAVIRRAIVDLLCQLHAQSLLDIPCGDFHWLSEVELPVFYTGADIVEAIVAANQQRYASPRRAFHQCDLTTHPLPPADLVLCRDCLVHLSFANIRRALANIKRSGSRYLLMTHFPDVDANTDIADGNWRPLKFQLPPFQLPPPQHIIVENCPEAGGAYSDKSLALWPIAELPDF
ncbi:MAG: class I SAM-dependent methyltransferase [Acidobacteria bacterium]|nr:class I SAM-dependent methyltransferase [Acidobacteriota bacterium]